MDRRPDELDAEIGARLRATPPAPLGLTTRLEAKLGKRAREETGLTLVERTCIVAVCGMVGAGGGPLAVGIALVAGAAYARFTVLVEAPGSG